jgi:hypothetical protein
MAHLAQYPGGAAAFTDSRIANSQNRIKPIPEIFQN